MVPGEGGVFLLDEGAGGEAALVLVDLALDAGLLFLLLCDALVDGADRGAQLLDGDGLGA